MRMLIHPMSKRVMLLTIHLIRRKHMKESVLRINDLEADKQAEEQTAEEPKKGLASKKLENQRLEIYPKDVYVTLGLPIGGTLINRVSRQKKKPFVDEVARRVGKNVERILPKDLIKEVLKYFGCERVQLVCLCAGDTSCCSKKLEGYKEYTIHKTHIILDGDPDKLPRPSGILVFEETETAEKDQWEVAIEGFATTSEDAVRVLQNLLLSMTDVKNMIQNFEAMKIAGATACNMIGVIPEVEVDEEETVTSLQAALAKDNFNSPELVEAVKSMFKVTAQLTKLAEEGPPLDIHPSFEQKNSMAEISSFTAVGMIQSSNTEKSVISVGSKEARLCASKIVKSAMADYMDGGGDDAADEFYSEASGTKTKTSLDNQLRSNDETNGEELDVEAIVKSAVEAYMECDEVDEDFVTPFTDKSEPKLGEALVIYANKQLYTVVMSNGRDDDADKLDEFASNIDKEVSEIPHFAWGDIDMVLVIIDACKDGEDNDLRFTYGCIPEALV
ncbi:hypothetical protein SASPL_135680 [Salvia splendens]|uniref:Uncharacterized protein n=1 Tax=Salvia splendens TaxID=180675 RepID=A0A8X8X0L9_SALSN|nr:hypothetical protein SASPL_135680 [Salvia splendens]